jgi:reactive chlorine resistance protein C
MSTHTSPHRAWRTLSNAERTERLGGILLRWSLIFLLVFFGGLKWTAFEAAAIHPFVSNSPILWWTDRLLGTQGASDLVGVIELSIAFMIAIRPWKPRLTAIGGFLGIGMFLTTLSFIVTTPNVGEGMGFLLKDVVLLAASTWIAGEAWSAAAASTAAQIAGPRVDG